MKRLPIATPGAQGADSFIAMIYETAGSLMQGFARGMMVVFLCIAIGGLIQLYAVLRLNEVFGEDNFLVNQIVWKRRLDTS